MKSIKYLMAIAIALSLFWLVQSQAEVPKAQDIALSAKQQAASEKAFHTMMEVLSHKRCVNCHPNDNVPKQGEDSHSHYFDMVRGENNHGFKSLNCATCHQSENNNFSGVPGAPEWSLAPESMKWEGLTKREIAASMLDPKRNGGRDHEALMHHLTEHELVLWAWDPGENAEGVEREKPPVPLDEYIEAVKTWFETGAIIPE